MCMYLAHARNLPFTKHIDGQCFSPLLYSKVRPIAVLRRACDSAVVARFRHLVGIFTEHDRARPLHSQLGRLPHRAVLGIRVVVDPHLATGRSESTVTCAYVRVYATLTVWPSTCCALQLFRAHCQRAPSRRVRPERCYP